MALDEPVSVPDVSIRAQILNLLKQLQQTYNLSYMNHQIRVMHLGKIVEEASPDELFANPLHPYTKALISASLPAHPGCHFPMAHCSEQFATYQSVDTEHKVACHLYSNKEPSLQHKSTHPA